MSQVGNIWDVHTQNRINQLHPYIKEKAIRFILQAQARGIYLRITSAFRSMAEQGRLYSQGRTTPGPVVTNARPGESFHNYGLAFDVVEIRNGAALWENSRWNEIGQLGKSYGLVWGGDWKFSDKPHFQSHSGPAQEAARRLNISPGYALPGTDSTTGGAVETLKPAAAAVGVVALGIVIGLLIK